MKLADQPFGRVGSTVACRAVHGKNTPAGTQPPRFVLFASGFIEAGYRRFIERRLREEFGFEGTPIEVSVRVREKRSRR